MTDFEKALMHRDGLTEKEAHNELKKAKKALQECCYSYEDFEDFMLENYGLEMDYIFDII